MRGHIRVTERACESSLGACEGSLRVCEGSLRGH